MKTGSRTDRFALAMSRSYVANSFIRRLARYGRRSRSGCWVWTGYLMTGYPYMSITTPIGKASVFVHRALWVLKHGALPDGLELDHKCRNTACFNPEHLEPVTHQENVRRGNANAPEHLEAIQRAWTPAKRKWQADRMRRLRANRFWSSRAAA